MAIPAFLKDTIRPDQAVRGMGQAFQTFVQDAFAPLLPDLHSDGEATGRDGCIDLFWETGGQAGVIECKYVGQEDTESAYAQALTAWRDTADRLQRNIVNNGGTGAQSQYKPWLNVTKPIQQYRFTVSCKFANESKRQELELVIQAFFDQAASHGHLTHLRGLKVKVSNWSNFEQLLRTRSALKYSWFPKLLSPGLELLQTSRNRQAFSSYLRSDRLAHYSIQRHLSESPPQPDMQVQSEEDLIADLATGQHLGLVIHGIGGIGKSRLTLELGALAHKKGWLVLRVTSDKATEHLPRMLAECENNTKVLLLVDYVERLSQFSSLLSDLEEIDEGARSRVHVRFIANCRSSFMVAGRLGTTGNTKWLDLSPPGKYGLWWESYRKATVTHILESLGITKSDEILQTCRDIPVLAVFLAYIQATNPEQLRELLLTGDFGTWVEQRLRMTFLGHELTTSLARFAAMLPIPMSVWPRLDAYHSIAQKLLSDGWLERVILEEVEVLQAAHDILADQIVLRFAPAFRQSVDLFVAEVLAESAKLGTIASCLNTFERLRLQPLFEGSDWCDQIGRSIDQDPASWTQARQQLGHKVLIDEADLIGLMRQFPTVWEGAIQEQWYRNRVGELARWLNSNRAAGHRALEEWLSGRVIEAAWPSDDNPFTIKWALRLAPERALEPALQWLDLHKERPRASHIYSELVRAIHDIRILGRTLGILPVSQGYGNDAPISEWFRLATSFDLIRDEIIHWINIHSRNAIAAYTIVAWLEAIEEPADLKPHISQWMEVHHADPLARVMFSGWWRWAEDYSFIKYWCEDWIKVHGLSENASYAYTVAIAGGSDMEQLDQHIVGWVSLYGRSFSAGFLYASMLESGRNRSAIEANIEPWLATFGTTRYARQLLTALISSQDYINLATRYVESWLDEYGDLEEARQMYKALVESKESFPGLCEKVLEWFTLFGRTQNAGFLLEAALDNGLPVEELYRPVIDWLSANIEYASLDYVLAAWLDAGGEFTPVQRYVDDWLATFRDKSEAQFLLNAVLKASDTPGRYEAVVFDWLKLHGTESEASHVFDSYLGTGADPVGLQDSVSAWLKIHSRTNAAVYVVKAWIQARGEWSVIRDEFECLLGSALLDYGTAVLLRSALATYNQSELREYAVSILEQTADAKSCLQILIGWLTGGHPPEIVETKVIEWLARWHHEYEAGYLIKEWMFYSRNVEGVHDYVLAWLEKYGDQAMAVALLITWLQKGGMLKEVEDVLLSWLEANRTRGAAGALMYWYVERGGNPEIVRQWLLDWFSANGPYGSSALGTKLLAKYGDLPSAVVRQLFAWCEAHAESADAPMRISYCYRYLAMDEYGEAGLSCVSSVLFSFRGKPSCGAERWRRVMLSLMANKHLQRERIDEVSRVFVYWLRLEWSFEGGRPYEREAVMMPLALLSLGKLEFCKDRDVFVRMMEMLGRWPRSVRRQVEDLLRTADTRYPDSELWRSDVA